jgi:acyl dehydratase
MRRITLRELAGVDTLDVGPGPWFAIEQNRVDAFAAATEDRQWIHVDPARAAAGPFGATVAHGYLTLSLLPHLLSQVLEVTDAGQRINYGLDRVRFPAPVPVGARIRLRGSLTDVTERGDGLGYAVDVTLEVEGTDRPGLVARTRAVVRPV